MGQAIVRYARYKGAPTEPFIITRSRRAGVTQRQSAPPSYTRSIADAWLVVEKLREDGWVVGLYIDDEPWEDPAGVGTHHCSLLGCVSPGSCR